MSINGQVFLAETFWKEWKDSIDETDIQKIHPMPITDLDLLISIIKMYNRSQASVVVNSFQMEKSVIICTTKSNEKTRWCLKRSNIKLRFGMKEFRKINIDAK